MPVSRPRLKALWAGALATTLAATGALAAPLAGSAQEVDAPARVTDGLLDLANTDTLGLDLAEGVETVTVFAPGDDDLKFNHGVVLLPFKGKLYAQWQTSELDEDAPETIVTYAVSDDGTTWSEPSPLTTPRTDGYTSSGGWWTDGETLVAYLNVWPAAQVPRGGYTMYRTSTDGITWSEQQHVLDADGQPVLGIIEQDTKALASGRVLTAFHVDGLFVKPYYTDDPLGLTGWTQGDFENQPNATAGISRELEPSWYQRPDGSIVMVFRDQGGGTLRKLAAVSTDDGATWTDSVETNIPDSRTKQSAGSLPDGTSYLAGNPTGTRSRLPLAILLSADGVTFDTGVLLRSSSDVQPKRYEGLYKNPGYSYPKSVLWNDHLYVAYGTNKEDVEFTRVPVASLSLRSVPAAAAAPAVGVSSSGLAVSWTAPEAGDSAITGYTVTVRDAAGVEQVATTTATSVTFPGLAAGAYTATVVASNAFGAGAASAASAAATVTAGQPVPLGVNVRAQCVNGSAAVAVYAANSSGHAADIRLAVLGTSAKTSGVAVGSAAYQLVPANALTVAGGSATITAYSFVNGVGYHSTYAVRYAGVTCG